MNSMASKITWYIFAILCVLISLYPITYFVVDRHFGLLSTKSAELLSNQLWNVAFYLHIILGGIALMIGWLQFSSKLRKTRISLHRTIGKIYIIAVIISGVASLVIAQSATGGINNVVGFSLMGVLWIIVTIMAYTSIRKAKVEQHQNLMIYSYALCFSAVTLRIWMPILVPLTGGFNFAYQIVAWLSWVPNLIVAFFIIQRKDRKLAQAKN